MAKRWITVELDNDVDHALYADLAHAIWSMAHVALTNSDYRVVHDGVQRSEDLNAIWDKYAKDAPWAG